MKNTIKVVFVQRFMLHYRINLFERINSINDIDFMLIYGREIRNTKFLNFKGDVKFKHKQLKTIQYGKGRKRLVFSPSLFSTLDETKTRCNYCRR